MGVRLLGGGADDRASKLSAGNRTSMKIFLRRHQESWNLIKNRLFKEPLLRGKEMALLNSCCCWRSVRRGSFASGVFTLIFYTMIVMAGAFHVNSVVYSPALLSFSLLMVVCAGFSVISSVLLLVGLCVDNRLMLLPWIVSVSMTTALDVVLSFYLFSEAQIDVIIAVIFVTDLLICCLNIYSILCVISQYQEYVAGRGRAGQSNASQTLPTVHCYLSGPKSNCPASTKVIVKVTDNGQTLLHNSESGLTSQFTRSTDLVSVGSEAPSPKDEVKETDEEKLRSPSSSNPCKNTNCSLTSPRASPSPPHEHFIAIIRQNDEDDECPIAQPKASGHGRRFTNFKSIGVEVNLYSSSEKHPLLTTEVENPINVISYSSTVSRHEENDPSLDDREQEADVTSNLQTLPKSNAAISVEL